jgi:hypothetical protein
VARNTLHNMIMREAGICSRTKPKEKAMTAPVSEAVVLRAAIPALTLDQAVIKATKPFGNGCAFRCRFLADGSTVLEFGCYNGPWVISGEAREILHGMMKYRPDRGAMIVDIRPETKHVLMAPDRQCQHCHYPLFEARKATT